MVRYNLVQTTVKPCVKCFFRSNGKTENQSIPYRRKSGRSVSRIKVQMYMEIRKDNPLVYMLRF
jgi:hypothetical protein